MNDSSSKILMQQILEANSAYRNGNPILTDQQFDDLCDTVQSMLSEQDWTAFRSKLFEKAGKVEHPYAMGSLRKLKKEEPEELCRWINEYVSDSKSENQALNISAKIDGISCRIHYENGKLVSATSRGDGRFGENLTDKIFYVKCVPQEISCKESVDIRGELICCDNDFESISKDFANPRNFVAGTMNRKDWTPEAISKITFVAYTVFGTKFTKKEQFAFLEENGFKTAWHKSLDIAYLQVKTAVNFQDLVDELAEYARTDFGYECDGLVLSEDGYRNEDVLIPEGQVAFKINEQIAETTVIDIDWRGPSKDGKIVPVAVLEPVEIGGVTVSQCTMHNLDFLAKMGIKYGSKIRILRSGDVIPKCVGLIENPENAVEIQLPEECPCCGSPLQRDGVDLRCMNPNCDAQMNSAITVFVKKFDIKHSAKKQLDNFGIKTIDDLLAFLPNQSYKSEVTLYNELNDKLFSASPKKIFCAMHFKGLAEKQLAKIVDHYTLDWIMNLHYVEDEKIQMLKSLPAGIGEKLIDVFWEKLPDAIENTRKIIFDSRFHYVANVDSETVKKTSNKGSICFTGALETMGRKEAQALAEKSGFKVKGGVTKGLTYLVIADPNSQSSKARKAREFGTKLLSEKEFLDICKGGEGNLEDL